MGNCAGGKAKTNTNSAGGPPPPKPNNAKDESEVNEKLQDLQTFVLENRIEHNDQAEEPEVDDEAIGPSENPLGKVD